MSVINYDRTDDVSVIAADFFPSQEVPAVIDIFNMVRRMIGDHIKRRNITDEKEFTFTDTEVVGFISDAVHDINSGFPMTAYTPSGLGDKMLIARGAMVMMLVSRGILEMKNAINFSDQGVSINTYDKGPSYQSWASMIANMYNNDKVMLKQAEAYRNMFCGIGSQYGY